MSFDLGLARDDADERPRKRSIEEILEPDPDAQRLAVQPDVFDVPRKLNALGRIMALSWFQKNYEDDPSQEVEATQFCFGPNYDGKGGFLEGYDAGNFSCEQSLFQTLADADIPFFIYGEEGRTRVASKDIADCKRDPYVLARRKSALVTTRGFVGEAPDWLFDGLIARKTVSMFVGASGELKSWIAMSLAKAAAWREPWLGRECDPCGYFERPRVFYANFDQPAFVNAGRFKLLGDQIEKMWHGRVECIDHPGVTLADDAFWESLENSLKPDLLVIDTLSSGSGGVDEKDTRFAEPIRRASAYAKKHGTAFVFVHHSPKCTGTESLSEIIRGSSAIAAALDVVYFVKGVKRFQTKDPTERRSVVINKKFRIGGIAPAPFTVRLTDEKGIELWEERRGKKADAGPLSDEDVVCEAINASPGIGGKRALAKATGLPAERVLIARRTLLDSERIENRGSGARPSLFLKTV